MQVSAALKRVRLIKYAPGDAASNMAADEAIFLACQQEKSMPTLRFYSWSPMAVSIGYSQRMSDALDLEKCSSTGITIVRRPTGGRAVLHYGDLSYSLVVPQRLRPFDSGIKESYKIVSDCFAHGLRTLQIDVEVTDKENGRDAVGHRLAALCFSTFSAHDICHQGRKLMGSAQKRRNGVILQHGSIYLDTDWGRVIEVFKVSQDRHKEQAVAWLKERMTSLSEISPAKNAPAQLADALASGVKEVLGVELQQGDFTHYEKELIERLRAEKYSSAGWCYKR